MVVIIIGILAAIAIPTFLAQRTRANNATAQSDLRNAAAAASFYGAAKNSNYSTCTETEITTNHNMNESQGVDVVVGTPTATSWSATAKHTGGDTTYTYTSTDGEVKAQ
jgi:type IV pilus assembly protein PilA